MRHTYATVMTALAAALLASPIAAQEADRFSKFEPGLLLEVGARTTACDVVTFTPDGKRLLAVGDDKVVRCWRWEDGDLSSVPENVLRWSVFREARGNIYALAVTPEVGHRYVAVGGVGATVGSPIAVMDLQEGHVIKALPGDDPSAIWALDFSPSGERIAFGKGNGAVGIWDWREKGKPRAIPLPKPAKDASKIILLAFLDEKNLLGVSRGGWVYKWNVTAPERAPLVLEVPGADATETEGVGSFKAALSPDKKLLARCSTKGTAGRVTLTRLDELTPAERTATAPSLLLLKEREFANCLAWDAGSTRLAVGTELISAPAAGGFSDVIGGRAVIYDVSKPRAAEVAEVPSAFYPDAIGFHPNGKQLVIAGGNNQEITLWDLKDKPTRHGSPILSPGRCIWSVGLDRDNPLLLGFRENRAETWAGPNQRGAGPLHVFDLEHRRFVPAGGFAPIETRETAQGWTIETEENQPYRWVAVSPDKKKRWGLPLDPPRDGFPRCYTFLPAKPGKPVQVVVGHFWGATVFSLTADGAKWARALVGHQGSVMAMGVSADGKTLVTASRDQTIAGWSLADWPSQAELGARFVLRDGKLVVDEVDAGSPGWEAGLSRGDVVLQLAIDNKELYDPGKREPAERRQKYEILTTEKCLERLASPSPRIEHYFLVQREGAAKPLPMLTTVRQRPLWRFFPTHDNEWVLWRWRDYYYDCSTHGDSYLGWQISSSEVSRPPEFYRAEQFRKVFQRPDKVGELMAGRADPERVRLPELQPPTVTLRVGRPRPNPDSAVVVDDEDVPVRISALAEDAESRNQRLKVVKLWVNDCLVKTWQVDDKASFETDYVVARTDLRRGQNHLTVQAYNHADGRGEAPAGRILCRRAEATPKLFGLAVGIGDYSGAQPRTEKSRLRLADLNADRDARTMQRIWKAQKGKLFADVEFDAVLNEQATPKAVFDRLRELAQKVGPDDLLVLFIGAHGTDDEHIRAVLKADKRPIREEMRRDTYYVLGPKFDPASTPSSCFTLPDFGDALANLRCHKLVLFDACHSGGLTHNLIRDVTVDGVGPVVLAACGPGQEALEYGLLDNNRSYGLFAMAVRRALSEEFEDADGDRNGRLDAGELAEFVMRRVPELVEEMKKEGVAGIDPVKDFQQPIGRVPEFEKPVPLSRR